MVLIWPMPPEVAPVTSPTPLSMVTTESVGTSHCNCELSPWTITGGTAVKISGNGSTVTEIGPSLTAGVLIPGGS